MYAQPPLYSRSQTPVPASQYVYTSQSPSVRLSSVPNQQATGVVPPLRNLPQPGRRIVYPIQESYHAPPQYQEIAQQYSEAIAKPAAATVHDLRGNMQVHRQLDDYGNPQSVELHFHMDLTPAKQVAGIKEIEGILKLQQKPEENVHAVEEYWQHQAARPIVHNQHYEPTQTTIRRVPSPSQPWPGASTYTRTSTPVRTSIYENGVSPAYPVYNFHQPGVQIQSRSASDYSYRGMVDEPATHSLIQQQSSVILSSGYPPAIYSRPQTFTSYKVPVAMRYFTPLRSSLESLGHSQTPLMEATTPSGTLGLSDYLSGTTGHVMSGARIRTRSISEHRGPARCAVRNISGPVFTESSHPERFANLSQNKEISDSCLPSDKPSFNWASTSGSLANQSWSNGMSQMPPQESGETTTKYDTDLAASGESSEGAGQLDQVTGALDGPSRHSALCEPEFPACDEPTSVKDNESDSVRNVAVSNEREVATHSVGTANSPPLIQKNASESSKQKTSKGPQNAKLQQSPTNSKVTGSTGSALAPNKRRKPTTLPAPRTKATTQSKKPAPSPSLKLLSRGASSLELPSKTSLSVNDEGCQTCVEPVQAKLPPPAPSIEPELRNSVPCGESADPAESSGPLDDLSLLSDQASKHTKAPLEDRAVSAQIAQPSKISTSNRMMNLLGRELRKMRQQRT